MRGGCRPLALPLLRTQIGGLLKLWELSGGIERKISRRTVQFSPSETVWGLSYEGFSVYTLFQPSQAPSAFWWGAAVWGPVLSHFDFCCFAECSLRLLTVLWMRTVVPLIFDARVATHPTKHGVWTI